MAPEMDVDGTQIRTQAKFVGDAGTDLTTITSRIFSTLAGLGNFWGDDDYGNQFAGGEGYVKQAGEAKNDVTAVAGSYTRIAGGMRLMADNVSVANWNSMASMPKLPE